MSEGVRSFAAFWMGGAASSLGGSGTLGGVHRTPFAFLWGERIPDAVIALQEAMPEPAKVILAEVASDGVTPQLERQFKRTMAAKTENAKLVKQLWDYEMALLMEQDDEEAITILF